MHVNVGFAVFPILPVVLSRRTTRRVLRRHPRCNTGEKCPRWCHFPTMCATYSSGQATIASGKGKRVLPPTQAITTTRDCGQQESVYLAGKG